MEHLIHDEELELWKDAREFSRIFFRKNRSREDVDEARDIILYWEMPWWKLLEIASKHPFVQSAE